MTAPASKRAGKQLAEAAEGTVANDALRLFGGSWTLTGGDGKAWAATDHPNAGKHDEGGSTFPTRTAAPSNIIARNGTQYELTTAGIDAGQVIASKFMNPRRYAVQGQL